MKIVFTKLSDQRHAVRVERSDGKSESIELDSRSFLRHDLAHFAVELELGLSEGVWGSVARCGSLSGRGLDGDDMALAETISGPMQTLSERARTRPRSTMSWLALRPRSVRQTSPSGCTHASERSQAVGRLRPTAARWSSCGPTGPA